jgi:hypothetical protein
MEVKKGDTLVYIGEAQENFEAGEEVTVVGKTPKGVKVEFDDGSTLEIQTSILKRDWELKEFDEHSEESDEDSQEDVEDSKPAKTKKEKAPKEKKQSLKKEPNQEAIDRRAAFIALAEKKGLTAVEQVPFTALKWEKRVVFEVYRGNQRFAFNCNEAGLSADSKALGNPKGHERTNDFLVENVPVDAALEKLVDESIAYAKNRIKVLAEERKEAAKKMQEAKAAKAKA